MNDKLSSQEKKLIQVVQSIPEFEKKLKDGRKVLRLLEKYVNILDATERKLSRGDNGLHFQLQQATTLKDKVQEIYKAADTSLVEIKEITSNLQVEKGVIEKTIAEVNQSISEVNDPESGINAQLNGAEEDKSSVREILLAVEGDQEQLGTKVVAIEEKIQEMNMLYEDFLETKKKIDDPETGLIKTLEDCGLTKDKIVAIEKQANTLYATILKIKDDSSAFLKDIRLLKQEAESKRDSIFIFAEESEKNNAKIAEIYGIATGTGLAGSFDKRKKELNIAVLLWGIVLFLGVIGYVGLLIWVYNETFKNGTPKIDVAAWYRLTLTLPALFLVGFASIQYSRERALLEKYAFKSATALALEAYTRLLTEKFAQKFEGEIVKFVLNAMTMIYKEPHEQEKKYKFNLGFNKIFNVDLEENQMQEISDVVEKSVHIAKSEKTKEKGTSI